MQDRLEGCNTYLQRAPVSVAFHLGLGDVSVYMPSVWPSISASSFHQCPAIGGVRCVIYLDNLLIMAGSRDHAALQCAAATRLLECLGFLVRELLKISDTANTGNDLLGPQHRLQERGTESAFGSCPRYGNRPGNCWVRLSFQPER